MNLFVPSPAVPIARPAAAQMNSTLGLMTTSAAAVIAARTGEMVVRLVSIFGMCSERLRVSHL